jgi:hypothetical protein
MMTLLRIVFSGLGQRWCDNHRTRRRAESAAAGTPRTWIGGTITDIDRVQSDVRLAAGSTEVRTSQDSTAPGPLSGRTARTAAVVVLVCGILLAAGVWQRNDHSSSVPATAGPDHTVPDVHALLAAWDSALGRMSASPLVITSGLQGQLGDWSLSEGDNNKRALLDGKVLASDDIAAARPAGNGQVRWQDGRIKAVPVLSAAQAARSLAELGPGKGGSCDECRPLILGSPRLITVKVRTATGPATAPAWSFAVRGSKVRVTWVAAGPEPYPDVKDLPYGAVSEDPGMSVRVDDGGGLVVSFIAGPPASAGPCGSDYTGRLVESRRVVAVLLDQVPSPPNTGRAATCTADGYSRTVRIVPAHPLGERIVISGATGMAVPRT